MGGLARPLRPKALFRVLAGDSGRLTAGPDRVDALGGLSVPTAVVAPPEARLAGSELRALPFLPTFLMNSAEMADLIAPKAP